MRAHAAVYVSLAILALLAPFLGFYPVFLMKLLCFAMFACAFNLLLGYTKMLSFGHAAYFGSSAYVTGWLVTVHGWGTIEGILAWVAVAMLLGLVIGAIAVRRQGIYFAMNTLALSQLVFFICLQADFTGGENGLQGIPRGRILGMIDLARDRTIPFQRRAAGWDEVHAVECELVESVVRDGEMPDMDGVECSAEHPDARHSSPARSLHSISRVPMRTVSPSFAPSARSSRSIPVRISWRWK